MRVGMIGAAALATLAIAPAVSAQQRPARPGTARPPATAPAARPVQSPQSRPLTVPPGQTLLILIKSTLLAFNHANLTNIYHVFYGLGSDSFRATNSPDRLSQAFAAFRANNIDLSPIVYLSPQLTAQPVIQQDRMRLVGFFPTTPARLNFDMVFEPSQGRWKMAQMNVSLQPVQVSPAPPRPQAPAQPPRRQR